MFQPQPTPYNPFASSYAPENGDVGYNFQPTSLVGGSGGGPNGFANNPTFNPAGTPYPPSSPPHLNNYKSKFDSMDAAAVSDDLATQEALARDYEPDLKGPLVGEKKSSHAITEEFARADPIYVAKTMMLPHKYSHYRPILGDGNCGWRAIGFSYFEALIQRGDSNLLSTEHARMMSMTNFITKMLGYDDWLFEDAREEFLGLLSEISVAISQGSQANAQTILLGRFNDTDKATYIIYWFRLLASTWLKSSADRYQPFLSIGVAEYCKNVLEPVNTEIEHLGLTVLIEILLKPIDVTVEAVYLDRSEGDEANPIVIGGPDIPILGGLLVSLLYRPGHYDILYKGTSVHEQQVLASPVAGSEVQVRRVLNLQGLETEASPGFHSHNDMSILAHLPVFFSPPPPSAHGLFTHEVSYEPTTASPYGLRADSLAPSSGAGPSPTSPLTPGSGPAVYPTTTLPMHPHSAVEGSQSQFRRSKYEYKSELRDMNEMPTFQTNSFKNSHFNTAHYANPDFQPEAWTPDCEEAVGKQRTRSSGF